MKILPYGWMCPRKEFFVAVGYGAPVLLIQFDVCEVELTKIAGEEQIIWLKAKCVRCGEIVSPTDEAMIAHGNMHATVEMMQHANENSPSSAKIHPKARVTESIA